MQGTNDMTTQEIVNQIIRQIRVEVKMQRYAKGETVTVALYHGKDKISESTATGMMPLIG